jgi:hypothetical protein
VPAPLRCAYRRASPEPRPGRELYARPPTSTAIPMTLMTMSLSAKRLFFGRTLGTEPPGLAGATPRERSDVLLRSALDDDLFVDESVLKSRSEGRRWKRGDDAAQTRRVVPGERPGRARSHASRSILLSLHGSRERAPTEAPARAETPVFHLTVDSACRSSRAVSRTVKYRLTLLMFSFYRPTSECRRGPLYLLTAAKRSAWRGSSGTRSRIAAAGFWRTSGCRLPSA